MSVLNIEIVGVSPHNKGALLMLEAIRERFSQHLPGARFAVPFTWPTDKRMHYGLYSTYPRDRGGFDKSRLCELVPRGFRQGVGFMAPSDIDVVLDASGFAYGDYWGLQKLQRRLVAVATNWKTDRNTFVVLPQALGPFKEPGMASAFEKVLGKADLICVRDKTSMQHVQGLAADKHNVRLRPDFTNLLHPELPERLREVQGAVLLIPNEKMVGQDQARRNTYLAFLRCAAAQLGATGRRLALLVHEGDGDRRLAVELNAMLPQPIEVLDEPSPLVTKAIIGVAHATVSSRFHGLISALAAAVPSVACGWTHKYQEVMADYGCIHLNIDLANQAAWQPTLQRLMAAAQHAEARRQLASAAADQRSLSEAMWAEVFALLRRRHPEAA
ncbi:polysaccharide pyruvyl transferase family protein [Pseudorhodoferax soli]|uniref:Colanic acid/amylovoran biosynthesis protein n=1 Tax=Pseudorhodoferax soli TaxID=545864 RepID=A0A368Y9D7_9BURK|nr:polysaccharide pyruvyl transferase family protein [Pseudorhodoferax soli]RCW76038.1 colanic acid/amylovoran biosynthesis protein [Pseudorhodoferax soli]